MAACSEGAAELCLRGKVSLGCSADTDTGRPCAYWWAPLARGRFPAAGAGARVEMPRTGAGDVVDAAAASRRRSSARLARRRARSIRLGWVWLWERAAERRDRRRNGSGESPGWEGLGFRFRSRSCREERLWCWVSE
uniref:Uncharacterized protein n=1 Tax=Arundo donax TaxID=35708 RepID=A0A0A8YGS6_ARUDO